MSIKPKATEAVAPPELIPVVPPAPSVPATAAPTTPPTAPIPLVTTPAAKTPVVTPPAAVTSAAVPPVAKTPVITPSAANTPAPAMPAAKPPVVAPLAAATPVAAVSAPPNPPATSPLVTTPPATIPLAITPPATVAPAATAGIEATVSSLKDGMAQAAAGAEKSRTQVTMSVEKVMKTAEEFVAFGQGNVEALVKSSQIWAAGVQDLSKQMAATAQAQFDETMSIFKALTGMKSLKDAFDLQTSFARSTLEKSLAESGRLTDASLKLTEQAMAPITARVTTAVEKFSKAA